MSDSGRCKNRLFTGVYAARPGFTGERQIDIEMRDAYDLTFVMPTEVHGMEGDRRFRAIEAQMQMSTVHANEQQQCAQHCQQPGIRV